MKNVSQNIGLNCQRKVKNNDFRTSFPHLTTLFSYYLGFQRKIVNDVIRLLSIISVCTEGGNRTHTAIAGHRILSPACLPVPPPRRVSDVIV